MTKRDKVLLAIIVMVGLVGGLWWFVVKPARADVSARTQEVQALQDEAGVIRDQISRLEQSEGGEVAQSVEGFRLTKAVPDRAQVPGAIVQMQRIATNSNVLLSGIRTSSTTDYGGFRATELNVTVKGRFFDVDDFMFRLHRQVTVDEQDRPRVSGRLFAVKSFELQLAEDEDSSTDAAQKGTDRVEGTLTLLVFSAPSANATPAAAVVPAAATTGAPATTAAPTANGGTR